ncbi:putative O-glycosylation ligase, exosortase A system-associated [Siccirubricoccus sp. KC 17139]|uniref:O-glycosylation ligase, exosortase A system-associated n=1 Tax=Siccirubricoccus soli TaxID=2899147 RepID=A0ABT1D729_9PROT|nr:putative O-glycosylation ligase, exosortase A system-associated [Siccirubricoccus soli]MCO6417744.1 putative O-glycosylation ligase, exosortase A system-associated [Siccirubricoccus soli]MCP2683879.1 putative O-glycosylation ligase, exosortase A system-associated [Siccirubricoccus soli]
MLRSLFLIGVFLGFLGLGMAAPFVLSLGYVWASIFRPQSVAYAILPAIPVSLILGALAILWFVLRDLRYPPRMTPVLALLLAMAVWVTFTTAVLAIAPEMAWTKWDWAFKTIVFAAFMVFVFRSRIQIEALVQVICFSFAGHFLLVGVKTLISGGGYGKELGLIGGNTGFGEGGNFAAATQMCVPLLVFLARHNLLAPRWKLAPLGYLGLAGLALIASVGTYQRSALIGLAVLGIAFWLRSRRKLLVGGICVAGALFLAFATSSAWLERMETIDDYKSESSAYTRILVWQWTLGFVADHPLGGGFSSYVVNEIAVPPTPERPEGYVQHGRAFHSSYFEMLGEHGWPGLALFLALNLLTLLNMERVRQQARGREDFLWCRDLATALQLALLVLLSSGAFVGIAFQPMFWYLYALGACLQHHWQRASADFRVTQRADALAATGRVPRSLRNAQAKAAAR